ncbi:hypothetical protein [Lacticaseibacillus brantae]|nr:hypothetical protein [Lacticaseibacillus brantae]
MNWKEFQEQSRLTEKEYRNVSNKLAHVGSFAYWPKPESNSTPLGRYKSAAEDLIVDSEHFSAHLEPCLNKSVILLGLNFGVPAAIKAKINAVHHDSAKILEIWQSMNYMSNQYGKKYGQKSLNHRNLQMRHDYIHGAYMTDFFKYPLDDTKFVATGLPTSTAAELFKEYKGASRRELVSHNADGLVHELVDILEVPRHFVIVSMHTSLKPKYIQKAIKERFAHAGHQVEIIDSMPHYQARKTKEEFKEAYKSVNTQIAAYVSAW